MKNYLDFEREIKTLEEELDKLKDPYNKEGLSLLAKGGGGVLELADDIRKERDKLRVAQNKKKPKQTKTEGLENFMEKKD